MTINNSLHEYYIFKSKKEITKILFEASLKNNRLDKNSFIEIKNDAIKYYNFIQKDKELNFNFIKRYADYLNINFPDTIKIFENNLQNQTLTK